jgi:hypothetical protein
VPIADHLSELIFGHQKSGGHSSLDLIAAAPALHVSTDRLHDRECGFDHVRAAKRSTLAELIKQNVDLASIQDERARECIRLLLNLIESLTAELRAPQ